MTDAGFHGSRVRLARELKGWSQADLARRARLTGAAVSQFESGATRPSHETAQILAGVLDVPSGFFSIPLRETHEGFFRSLRRTSVLERRRARALAFIAHDIAQLSTAQNALPPPSIPAMPVDDLGASRQVIEDLAAAVREEWGVPPGPAPHVVSLLEVHGAMVIRLPLTSADVDAFSLPFPDRPVVVLGTDKGDRARSRFDAAHELGHLVMHGEHLWGIKEVEQQAHAFAAAFLMPADDIREELPAKADWPSLFELKKRWQVSIAALLMRARTLGRMTEPDYLTAIKAASARGWRRKEPVVLGEPEQPSALDLLLEESGLADSVLPRDVVQALSGATPST